jgi:CrcB protein
MTPDENWLAVRVAVLIAAGGSLGAVARYAVDLGIPSTLGATFAVNVAGCFLLGALVTGSRTGSLVGPRERYLVGPGFCSSFTTYSTFVLDIVQTRPPVGLAYLVASYAVGFASVGVATAVVRFRGGQQ